MTAKGSSDRTSRLAAALKENLRRRKVKARAKAGLSAAADAGAPAAADASAEAAAPPPQSGPKAATRKR